MFTTPVQSRAPRPSPVSSGEDFSPNPFRPDWTPEAISRFFGRMGTNPHAKQVYFSLQAGPALVRFLELAGVIKGRVIDYGCGPGHLLDLLSRKDIDLHAADFSAESTAIVSDRMAGRPRWHGVQLIRSMPSPELPDSAFDLATCVETIEHLADEPLNATLDQLKRIVKPGGTLFLTTPASENLEAAMTYCPFCEAEYHAWQHVRSFTPASARKLLEDLGWEVVYCESVILWRFMPRPWPGRWHINLRYLMGSWNRLRATLLDRLRPRAFPNSRLLQVLSRPGPNLLILARKPANAR